MLMSIEDFSQRDPFVSVQEDDSMLEAAIRLKNHHRIAIVNKEGTVTGALNVSSNSC